MTPNHPRSASIRFIRQGVRIFVLTSVLVILIWPQILGAFFGLLPGGLSILLASSSISTGVWKISFLWIGLFTAAIIWKRRFFCRWVCPLGLVNETLTRGGNKLGLGRPCRHVWPIGQVLGSAIAVSGLLATPMLLWLDPMAIVASGWLGLFTDTLMGLILLLPLSAALAASFFGGGLWCRRLCPLGGLQEVVYEIPRNFSRKQVASQEQNFGRKREAHHQEATGDSRLRSSLRGALPWFNPVTRRSLLGLTLGTVWALWPWNSATGRQRLRPPGRAATEEQFLAMCCRCGNCVRVCPARILEPDLLPASWSAFGAPVVRFSHEFCQPSCTLCGTVCPTGAITLQSPVDKFCRPIGYPVVEGELCLLADEKECGLCRAHCPTGAIYLHFSPETYSVLPVVRHARCTGCGACELVCPTTPRKAIRLLPI